MAYVAFKKGQLANLPNTYSEGTFYVTTDERAMYLDISDSARIRLGDFQEFPTVAALEANTNPSTSALYYVAEINCLAKWNGSEYIQINLDTGATSVEVTGSGNAITGASYNASTRKITLTKGETFATKAQLDAAVGASTDASSAITLYGVKKYAQEQAAAVLGTAQDDKDDNTVFGAKAYADDVAANASSTLIGASTDDKDDDTIYGAKAYADDAVATAKTELIGDSANDDKDDDTIEGAKRYADDVKSTLEGNASTDTYSSTTIAGAKKYADKVGSDLLGTAQDASSVETVHGARALANEKVASITAGKGIDVSTASPNSTTAPKVEIKLSEKTGNSLSLETGTGEEGLFAHIPTVSVVKKGTANDDFAASYQVTVDGTAVGVDINIPKDYLVKSASVATVTAADKAAGGKFENNANFSVGDKYLDFVVNTKADGDGTAENDAHIYLNVADLAHIYTEGNGIDISASDVVSVVIDSNNANGLSVGANGIALAQATDSVTGAMTAADHVKLTAAYEAITIGSF